MTTRVSSASASHLLRRSVSRSARRDNQVLPRNRKLRAALNADRLLILLRKEVANCYTPVMPVYVVDDYPEERAFLIALDEAFRFMGDLHDLPEPQRAYARRLAKQRLHQPAFRTRVLLAYDTRCTVCSLHHGSLLDAAHIVPDGEPRQIEKEAGGPSSDQRLTVALVQALLSISQELSLIRDEGLNPEHDSPRP